MVAPTDQVKQSNRTWLLAGGFSLVLLSCGSRSGQPASHISHFPEDLDNAGITPAGLYRDGWASKAFSVSLWRGATDRVLILRGTMPRIEMPEISQEVEVMVDNKLLDHRQVRAGNFEIATPVDGSAGPRRVSVAFTKVQVLPNGDGRPVSARLSFIGFDSFRAGIEIVRGDGIRLGSDWGDLETFDGETFRWVENDAEIGITTATTGEIALELVVEPGPGVGRVFLLRALDSTGRQVASALVNRRQTTKMFIPVEAGKTNEIRLHVDGGGKATPRDSRVLNFRVFRIVIAPLADSLR
jgi:hypothetical protein